MKPRKRIGTHEEGTTVNPMNPSYSQVQPSLTKAISTVLGLWFLACLTAPATTSAQSASSSRVFEATMTAPSASAEGAARAASPTRADGDATKTVDSRASSGSASQNAVAQSSAAAGAGNPVGNPVANSQTSNTSAQPMAQAGGASPAGAPAVQQPATGGSSVAPPAPRAQTELTPADRRMTDEAIRGDLGFLRGHVTRLKALNDTGTNAFYTYHFAKATHWIDFAIDEYQMKNRSGVIEQAQGEGDKLIAALEAKRDNISMETPIVPLSTRVRDDLWAEAARFKADKDVFRCVAGDVARMEVQLVWAGHIQRDWGWRSAKPHLQAAERYYRDILLAAETCPKPVVASSAAGAKQALDDAAIAKLPATKQIEILADRVHFAYDRAAIAVTTAPILDRIASILRANKAIVITIEGHADERGGDNYNLRLSERRANAVRTYLSAAGVEAARMKVQAFGKTKPEVKAADVEGHALNRRVVIVPSITQDLQLNKQRDDLQTKGDPAARGRK